MSELPVLIPDAIEPIIGWKALNMHDGNLWSPSYPMLWDVDREVRARCHNPSFYIRWMQVPIDKPMDEDHKIIRMFNLANAANVGPYIESSKPNPAPADGKRWGLESISGQCEHSPGDRCSCGIYIAKDQHVAAGYGEILAKVAGWGKVIEHQKGWKVEYAYPLFFRVPSWHKDISPVLEFGLPVEHIPHIQPIQERPLLWTPKKKKRRSWTTLVVDLILGVAIIGATVNLIKVWI